MLKRLIIFVMLLCFAVAGTSFAASSRTLDKNTERWQMILTCAHTAGSALLTTIILFLPTRAEAGSHATTATGRAAFITLRFQATGICVTKITPLLRSARRVRF